MGIGKGGSPTTVNSQQNQNVASQQVSGNVPTGLSNFQDIYNRADTASQTPYQAYGGELVNPINAQQYGGISTIDTGAGMGMWDINHNAGQQQGQLAQNAVSGISPLTSGQIQNYMNPYQSNVMDALTQNINETNAQQNQQVKGNAIAQGALGGDREAVAESELARQQNLGNSPAIANALQQGYTQALGTAQQQYQQLPMQQAAAYQSLGGLQLQQAQSELGNYLQSGEAQFNAGTAQQQTGQAQDTAGYQQYLQQLAYPYQQAQFLAGIGIPAAGAMGGQQYQSGQQYQTGYNNQITTPPGLSLGQGIAGAGLIAGGLGFGLGSGTGTAAEGGRIQHRYPGGSTGDPDNPYAVEPWNIKPVDITKMGSPGTQIQTPQNSQSTQNNQISPIKPLSNTQASGSGSGQQTNPLTDITQGISAAKGLYGLGSAASGWLGGLGAGSAASALGAGTDAGIAIGGLGVGDAAAAAGAGAVAADVGAGAGLADLFPLALLALKRGGSAYPRRLAMGGDAVDAADQTIATAAAQSGPLADMMQNHIMMGNKPKSFADGGDAAVDDGGDQPWALENRWPTQDTDTAIPPWKSADPKGDAAALRNYGVTAAPEVSPSSAYPMPQDRPSPYVKPDDADDNPPAAPDSDNSAPTKVAINKGTGFDPATASYQDIMNKDNFKGYAPQRQSLISLIKDPKTRGDALMEMGLRILAAPPTSKSGLSEIATGALGTQQAYNQFSKDATTAQEKAQELAAKLKGMSNADDKAEDDNKFKREQLKALTGYREGMLNQRFQKLAKGNIVMGNYQYPGPTGAVVAAYADKSDGHIYDAHTHEELNGGRWAGTNAVDLGISKPPGSEPAKPESVPEGSRWSPTVKMWKDPAGKIYDASGQLVQQ